MILPDTHKLYAIVPLPRRALRLLREMQVRAIGPDARKIWFVRRHYPAVAVDSARAPSPMRRPSMLRSLPQPNYNILCCIDAPCLTGKNTTGSP